ncbi:SMI1/KNR4 family protein [Actinokineospora auranticolor]|uniref:Knr4/Smi1-like domain-containing protein n=1 Tax=Actinokineospora auranticolor TaxID=155976 RepID=A0A2S6GKC9_9PSEU|nr:SMI1/KNR4 family protein [Actinokineospora auranticolor]PPK65611.1 hypothetical protein CLV40_11395 [Actinokineospora auranticolor]
MRDDVDDFFDLFEAKIRQWRPDGAFAGLTDAEIEAVRAAQGVSALPAYYIGFLRRMGREAGAFLVGTDIFHPRILEVPEGARELLAENDESHLLPDGAVVFALHQGYMAYWFDPNPTDNPRVHLYVEGRDAVREWPSFTEFLLDELAG